MHEFSQDRGKTARIGTRCQVFHRVCIPGRPGGRGPIYLSVVNPTRSVDDAPGALAAGMRLSHWKG